ncbi:MAG: hypothetical protein WB341_02795 [Terracidiphilus sp.]
MKSNTVSTELELRAAKALAALLGQVSGIKLKEMRRESPSRGRAAGILARIEVFGHSHMLACEVNSDAEPGRLRAALRDLQDGAAQLGGEATPVLIAPYLSPEAQALCKENQAGFLDLEGNARLSVGEVFIVMRSLPCRVASDLATATPRPPVRSPASPAARNGLRNFSRDHAAAALTA